MTRAIEASTAFREGGSIVGLEVVDTHSRWKLGIARISEDDDRIPKPEHLPTANWNTIG